MKESMMEVMSGLKEILRDCDDSSQNNIHDDILLQAIQAEISVLEKEIVQLDCQKKENV